jgi:hypothetical protein
VIRRGPTLRIAGSQHDQLIRHLFPGDGLEAAAILVCSRLTGRRTTFVVRSIMPVPYEACPVRTRDRLTWSGDYLEEAIDTAEPQGDSLFLMHSHPGGFFAFSAIDDASDDQTLPGLRAAIETDHGSALMTPDGAVRARVYDGKVMIDVELVVIVGDDIRLCWSDASGSPMARPLAFTADMTAELSRLSAFVVGVSGTGSIIAEQTLRMGFGDVGLCDPDRIELKNLNRILNATVADAQRAMPKVTMFATAAAAYAPQAHVRTFIQSLLDREVVLAAAESDVLFCCVDSHEGRQLCDLIAAAFAIPLIDMGVQIPVRRDPAGHHRIGGAYGRIDYVQPLGASLEDREVYSPQSVAEEYIARVAPDQHASEVRDGYMKGRAEEAPSVIALNMRTASAAMMEFIARTYPFRHDSNRDHARTIFDLASGDQEFLSEDEFAATANPLAGGGNREPLLGLPTLNRRRHALA